MSSMELDTRQRPLAVNLDQSIFGSFAEIGAVYVSDDLWTEWERDVFHQSGWQRCSIASVFLPVR